MAVIPICERIVTSLTKESAFGVAIEDSGLDKMFHIMNPDLPEITLDTMDDMALIKGHEFLDDVNAFKVLFQNVKFSLTGIPLSAEFCGWLMASAMGNITSAQISSSGDYKHTAKIQDRCISDQLPSRTLGLLWDQSASANKKYAGAVVDSFTIRINEKGYVTCDVSFITDGTEVSGSGIAVPSKFHSTNFWYGLDTSLKYADFGSTTVDNTAKLAGLEITFNNNLAVDEAKNKSFATKTKLPELRMGDRTIEISLTMYVNETDQAYIDSLAAKRKVIQVIVTGNTLTGNNKADLVIDIPQARWIPAGKGFDGSYRTLTFGHLLYMDDTLKTPLQITTTTRDAAYAVAYAISTAPLAITDLAATAAGRTVINLAWTAPDDKGASITGYKIEVSLDNSTWTELIADTASALTTYQHTGLTASSRRYYRVSAINSVGTAVPSNVANATTAA